MIVSWNWLTDYVRLDMPVEALTDRLALAGLNHESTQDVGGDLAIDLEVTSNRPDCNSHLGVAREISVLFEKPRSEPVPRPAESGPRVETQTSVSVEAPDLCPRFTARVVSGIRVDQSPWWLRKRLETLGVRPISNVVDATNYVMFECGQPLHAYDLDRLAGRRLVVRRARKGEKLTAINNKVYELEPAMLTIADSDRPVGLAGVMGGLDTEIGAGTTNVLIEAAHFDAMTVRRTARALGLHSESSFRFERPIDPAMTEWASHRCAELILKIAGGTLHPGMIDTGAPSPQREAITLRLDQIARILGIAIDRTTGVRILQGLGLELLDETTDLLTFRPPSWRSDLEREIDLIEEVARIHGYDHIPEDRPVPLNSTSRGRRERVETEIRNQLVGLGFDEAVTFSLVDDALAVPLHTVTREPPLHADHSRRRKENALRQSLVPSLLAARAHNEAHGTPDAELFEIANVYLPRPAATLPNEPAHLAIVSGRDFLALKGVIESLLARLHAEISMSVRPESLPLFAHGRAAELSLGNRHLGYLGEVDRARLDALELRGACSAAELDFDVVQSVANLLPRYRPLPLFPVIARDLSLVVPLSLAWSELAELVQKVAGPTLDALTYLDTFRGGSVADGWQSVHFGLRFRHPSRTLTGDEADAAVNAIVAACAARFGATLRT